MAPLAGEVFGANRGLDELERLRGGTKKGVYRLRADDGRSAILYVWSEEENFWPDSRQNSLHASGLDTFEAARNRLEGLGVRVPRLYLASRASEPRPYLSSRANGLRGADVAVVEDVRGGTLEARLQQDPAKAEPLLDRLAEGLRLMSRCRSPYTGEVLQVDAGAVAEEECPETVMRWATKDLREAAGRVERIAAEREAFEAALKELGAAVRPRTDYGLIHGELGPDHVLVDDRDEPVMIDIDGAHYFDIEWEHVFLRIRFGEHYERLRVDGLDEARMRFYQLAQHLSLVAGPLRLLDGDFPDREFMTWIAANHTEAALAFLRDFR
ncbi:phosphotransferase [Nonomuraea sp. NPDC050404]|uniref:phosphotransferase n=1 Tax=Nonomuraea sp. NPDC050404 TaxID=3155783 RepID=UPI00340C3B61